MLENTMAPIDLSGKAAMIYEDHFPPFPWTNNTLMLSRNAFDFIVIAIGAWLIAAALDIKMFDIFHEPLRGVLGLRSARW